MQKIKIGGALIIILVSFLTITTQAYAYDAPVTEEGISPDVVSTSIPHTHAGSCYTQQLQRVEVSGWNRSCTKCGLNDVPGQKPCPKGGSHTWGSPWLGHHYEDKWVSVLSCGLSSSDGTVTLTRNEDSLSASVSNTKKVNSTTYIWYCYDDGQLSETLTGSSIPRNHESYSLALKYTESMGAGGTVWINNYKDDIHHVFLNDTKPIQVYLNGSKISGLYYDLPGILPAGKTKRNYLYFGH